MKQRYFLELAYNGKRFHGWQIQPNMISVQEVLEKALSKKLQEKIAVVGAGRTDTGVHASFFVAHFETEKAFDLGKLQYGLNHLLGDKIAIYDVYAVKNEVHARFSAISRKYVYKITKKKNPFLVDTSYLYPYDLDIEIMNKACAILLKTRDFTSFSKLHSDAKTNICDVQEAFWTEENDLLFFTIKADRFLRNMVRAVVGTLLDVGRGKLSLNDFESVVNAKNRSMAGISVAPEGLFLQDIVYPKDIRL